MTSLWWAQGVPFISTVSSLPAESLYVNLSNWKIVHLSLDNISVSKSLFVSPLLCVYMTRMCGCLYHKAHVEVRGQLDSQFSPSTFSLVMGNNLDLSGLQEKYLYWVISLALASLFFSDSNILMQSFSWLLYSFFTSEATVTFVRSLQWQLTYCTKIPS